MQNTGATTEHNELHRKCKTHPKCSLDKAHNMLKFLRSFKSMFLNFRDFLRLAETLHRAPVPHYQLSTWTPQAADRAGSTWRVPLKRRVPEIPLLFHSSEIQTCIQYCAGHHIKFEILVL